MKWLVGLLAVLAIPAMTFAGATMQITGAGGVSAVSVAPGAPITVEFHLNSDVPWFACGAAMTTNANPAYFKVTARTHNAPVSAGAALTNDSTTTGMRGTGGYLDPTTSNIGYTDFAGYEDYPAGNYTLSVMTLSNAALPGVYNITIGDPGGGINCANIDQANIPVTVGAALKVTVTPEPASLLLLGLGGLFLRRRSA